MDTREATTSLMNACRNIIEQYRDAVVMHDVGLISDETYYERQGKFNASLRIIAMLEGGEEVSEEQFAQIIAEETEAASQPSKYELLRADVDYALMLGGEL